MKRILLVEDDYGLGASLQQQLEQHGLHSVWVQTKAAALSAIKQERFDLVVLDIGLPDGSGLDLAKEIALSVKLPSLFLTAMNSAENRLEALELGASEFIPKPFFLREFILRVERILGSKSAPFSLRVGAATLDFEKSSISFDQGGIEFPSQREMLLLKALLENAPTPVSRSELMRRTGSSEESSGRSIDNSISHLRQILMRAGTDPIRAVRGVGYQWVAEN